VAIDVVDVHGLVGLQNMTENRKDLGRIVVVEVLAEIRMPLRGGVHQLQLLVLWIDDVHRQAMQHGAWHHLYNAGHQRIGQCLDELGIGDTRLRHGMEA
jgi:hypothetical protein